MYGFTNNDFLPEFTMAIIEVNSTTSLATIVIECEISTCGLPNRIIFVILGSIFPAETGLLYGSTENT